MAVDLLPKRDIIEQIVPDDATSPSWGAGGSWAFGSWIQIIASIANDFVLTQVQLYEVATFTSGPLLALLQMEIGVGAAASESAIATIASGLGGASDGTTENKTLFTNKTHFVAPTFIAAGSRVAQRAATNLTGGVVGGIKLVGYDARDFETLRRQPRNERFLRSYLTTSQGADVDPTLGVNTVSSAASAWGLGSWVEFVATASKPRLVKGVIASTTSASVHPTFEIGTGAGGSEITRGRVPLTGRAGLPPAPGVAYFYRPVLVKPGERIAVRVKDNSGAAISYSVMLLTDEVK